jgi:hypothetical protein
VPSTSPLNQRVEDANVQEACNDDASIPHESGGRRNDDVVGLE